jgi:hypothetical protein
MLTRVVRVTFTQSMRTLAVIIASVGITPALFAQAPGAGGGSQRGANACPIAASVSTPSDTSGRALPDTAPRSRQLSSSQESPTIVIYAAASAREVRFASQPRITVRLCGAVTDSVHVIERRNLPDPVQPGVTYRDVYIAVEIIGRLNAECLAQRITGQRSAQNDVCAAATVPDSSSAMPAQRRPPS